MPANTTKGFPYPLPVDNVADYPTTAQQLATLLEAMVPYRFATGLLAFGAAGVATASQAVTFPAGLFTVAPIVTCAKASAQAKAIPTVTSITTAGFNAGFATGDGTNVAGAVTMYWIAIQSTPTVAFSRGIGPVPTDAEIAAIEREGRELGEDVTDLVATLRAMQLDASTPFEGAES